MDIGSGSGGSCSPDEQAEEAALILCTMKQSKPDPDQAKALEEMKREILGKLNQENNQITVSRRQPRISHSQESATNLPGDQQLPFSEDVATNLGQNHTPFDIPLVPGLHGIIGECRGPFKKKLLESDLKKNLCRFNISDVRECLFPLLKEDEDSRKGIEVTVYDLEGIDFNMLLKKWGGNQHVLRRGWRPFATRYNNLLKNQVLTIWIFRNLESKKLCFLIKIGEVERS